MGVCVKAVKCEMKEYIVQAIAQETIDAFDAQNAPELIRCSDCAFRQSKVSRIIDGKKCNLCEMVKGYKPADWFCADGKRKGK